MKWVEFELRGPIETMRYRVSEDGHTVQWWSKHWVPGFGRKGWNVTSSENAKLHARNALKKAGK